MISSFCEVDCFGIREIDWFDPQKFWYWKKNFYLIFFVIWEKSKRKNIRKSFWFLIQSHSSSVDVKIRKGRKRAKSEKSLLWKTFSKWWAFFFRKNKGIFLHIHHESGLVQNCEFYFFRKFNFFFPAFPLFLSFGIFHFSKDPKIKIEQWNQRKKKF